LHGRKGCRGEQHEAKVCHDGLDPGNDWQQDVAINEYALGRIVAACNGEASFILR
jgi:hypothetical protein